MAPTSAASKDRRRLTVIRWTARRNAAVSCSALVAENEGERKNWKGLDVAGVGIGMSEPEANLRT